MFMARKKGVATSLYEALNDTYFACVALRLVVG